MIELNAHTRLQNQYIGFLNTPILQFDASDMPYEVFKLDKYSYDLPSHFIMPHPIRLGQRMEVFMAEALLQEYEILAKNVQIISNKRTLGELDFLLKDKRSEKIIHLEMVYKFYFYRPELKGNWIARLQGPNAKDHLQLKLNKLKSHQFPLLYQTETINYLEEFNLHKQPIKQQLLFKAQIFIPYNYQLQHCEPYKNPISGFYFEFEQLDLLNNKDLLFYIPIKNDWVAKPIETDTFFGFKTFKQKISAVLKEQRSSLFWILNTQDGKIYNHFASWW